MTRKTLITAIFLFLFLAFPKLASASTLHLSPGSGTIPQGGALSVRVTLSTGGEGVNGVSAYVSYSSDTVNATVSCAGAFAIGAECSAGGGSIRISRGSINPVSGNVTVGTITLKGKTQGNATVSFVGGSGAPRASDSSDSLDLGGSSGGAYTIGPPQASTGSQGEQSQTATTQQDTTAPKISDVATSEVTSKSARISWKTDKPTDSVVEYGLEEGKYFLTRGDTALATDHGITLEGPLLTPGVQIHLRVLSKDAHDNKSEGADVALQLLGFTVQLTILDEKHKPLKHVDVELFSDVQKATTDENGLVTFDNVTLGKHVVIVKSGNLEKSFPISVSDALQTQSFPLTASGMGKPLLEPLYMLIIAYAGIIIGIVVVFIRMKKNHAL